MHRGRDRHREASRPSNRNHPKDLDPQEPTTPPTPDGTDEKTHDPDYDDEPSQHLSMLQEQAPRLT